MDTQNTPIHITLWHKDFWAVITVNLLLSTSVTLLFPAFPSLMASAFSFGCLDTGVAFMLFAVGLFLPGIFCSYLVQKYRRNMVCQMSMLLLVLSTVFLWLVTTGRITVPTSALFIYRIFSGSMFGLAQMVLSSTLVIDTTESFKRTEANHAAEWFRRFSIALGPGLALYISKIMDYADVLFVSMGLGLLSMIVLSTIHFPFKSPEDTCRILSLDRFFMPKSYWLTLNLFLSTFSFGLILSTCNTWITYCFIGLGFLTAILTENMVFANASIKSEAVTGLVLAGASVLILLTRHGDATTYIAPFIMGLGYGALGSRFLLFFVKLSMHCQRGTSQSTFFLAWESGLIVGIGLGLMLIDGNDNLPYIIALSLIVVSLLLYILVAHPWYMKHKNR